MFTVVSQPGLYPAKPSEEKFEGPFACIPWPGKEITDPIWKTRKVFAPFL